ncbi:MAG: YjbQ family protein [Deltaproteobacteria bacterium]|nr:MAG: YjbQ family protein [Deltaproteobacteria bacterium]
MITKEIEVKTSTRMELVDITPQVKRVVEESGISEGMCSLYVPHTTAAVTINENADPSVKADIIGMLSQLIPAGGKYHHLEGNADAHVKATLVGPSEILLVNEGRLSLGTWQGVFFCEFDGPRRRRILVRVY